MIAPELKSIKAQLLKQLKTAGNKNALTLDLVEQYLFFRGKLDDLKEAYAAMIEQGLAPTDEEVALVNKQISETTTAMCHVLDAIGCTAPTKRRQVLEAEINAQLQQKGLHGEIFKDRVDAFLKLWDAFQESNRCLLTRGRTYFTISSAGKEYEKDNAATKDLVTFAKAMGDILDELDVTVKGYADPEDDEL